MKKCLFMQNHILKRPRPRVQTISEEEHALLVNVMRSCWAPLAVSLKSKFLVLYLLAYSTGLRPQELARLRYQDIQFDTATIHVGGPKDCRDVSVPATIMGLLQSCYSSDYVFVVSDDNGQPYGLSDIHSQFQEFVKEAGIVREISFFDARHTYLVNSAKIC